MHNQEPTGGNSAVGQLDELVKSVEEPWREIPDKTEDSQSTGTGQHHPQDLSSTQERERAKGRLLER